MAAFGALPGPFHWISIAFMEHLHNQVAAQTHSWFAKNQPSFAVFMSHLISHFWGRVQ